MNLVPKARRALLIVIATAVCSVSASRAGAQSVGELNQQLAALAPEVNSALSGSNFNQADAVIDKLDQAEAQFARLAENPRTDRSELISSYSRLEEMLNRLYSTFKQKKEDCINQMQGGAECDYTQPEQLSLKALYPLSWLRYQGASVYGSSQPEMAKKLLNQAIDGFTESTLAIFQPELLRENLLGRAYGERELGKFDKTEYDKAIADFKQIMNDGPNTKQYKPAQQGLATTYAAMGQLEKAAELTSKLASGSEGGQKQGLEMLHLTQLFKAEAAANDPAKKAAYHREAVEFMRSKQDDKTSWAVIQAAVAQNVRDPIAEFSGSSDPFEKWLLANVLLAKKQNAEAAKYYLEAARSGRYPKAYKFAAEIYYNMRRYDVVQQLVSELARQPGNPDSQWAAYMRFRLPYLQYEQGGMKNAQIENQWLTAANDYLKAYPHGQYAYEPRFRLGERAQRNKQFIEAAATYAQVTGNPDFEFHAKFNGAECNYLALVEAASAAKDSKTGKPAAAASVNRDELRRNAIEALRATVKMEPAVERGASAAERSGLRDIRGRATYMLASLLQREPKVDYADIASMLEGYESQYPSMKERFVDVAEWRIQALDQLGKYAQLERDVRQLLERSRDGAGTSRDFIKEVGMDFWKSAAAKRARGDIAGADADVKLTALTYGFFEDEVQSGKAQAKNLTGTLSILGKAYIAMGDVPKAEKIFGQVVKADPGSPDANAGLARIAQAKKDYKNSVELWTTVENVAAESDDLWYEAKYNIAVIYAAQGNVPGACNKLAVTRAEHPSLGTPEMKAQWDALQRKLCLSQVAK